MRRLMISVQPRAIPQHTAAAIRIPAAAQLLSVAKEVDVISKTIAASRQLFARRDSWEILRAGAEVTGAGMAFLSFHPLCQARNPAAQRR
jgi:hypothetical protein